MEIDPNTNPQWQAELDRQHGKFGSPSQMLFPNPYGPQAEQPRPATPDFPNFTATAQQQAEQVLTAQPGSYAPSHGDSDRRTSSGGGNAFVTAFLLGLVIVGGYGYWSNQVTRSRNLVGKFKTPMVQTFSARRKGSVGVGCSGQLTFAQKELVFRCDGLAYTVVIPKVGAAASNDGVMDADGKAYHFAITGKSDDEVLALFHDWVSK